MTNGGRHQTGRAGLGVKKDKGRRYLVFIILLFVFLFSGRGVFSENKSEIDSLAKLLFNGEVREGFAKSRRYLRQDKSSRAKEQFVIFAIHRNIVNKRIERVARACVRDSKDSGHALATLAIIFALQNKTKSAIKVAGAALKIDENNARALMALGLAYRNNGDVEKANQAVLNAVTKAAGDQDVMVLASRYYGQQGNSTDVFNTLDLWTKESPDSPYAHYLKGQYFYKGLALNKAAEEYKKAISLNPGYWDAQRGYAYILTYQKKYKEAVPIFQSMLKKRPGYGTTYIHYAECLEALGKFKDSIDSYSMALEVMCDTTDSSEQIERIPHVKPLYQVWATKASASRARLLMKTGELEAALSDADRLTNLFPSKMEPRYIKTLVLMKMKDYGRALKEVNLLISANDDISLFYRKRSEIHKGLSEFEKAKRDIELAQRLERTGSIHDSGK